MPSGVEIGDHLPHHALDVRLLVVCRQDHRQRVAPARSPCLFASSLIESPRSSSTDDHRVSPLPHPLPPRPDAALRQPVDAQVRALPARLPRSRPSSPPRPRPKPPPPREAEPVVHFDDDDEWRAPELTSEDVPEEQFLLNVPAARPMRRRRRRSGRSAAAARGRRRGWTPTTWRRHDEDEDGGGAGAGARRAASASLGVRLSLPGRLRLRRPHLDAARRPRLGPPPRPDAAGDRQGAARARLRATTSR